MSRVLFALTSQQGTACSETAVCSVCSKPEVQKKIEEGRCKGHPDDPIAGTWVECTQNEALKCIVCGFFEHPARYVVRALYELETESELFHGEPLFWSNDLGWVDFESATQFEKWEKDSIDLPMGGEWHRIK